MTLYSRAQEVVQVGEEVTPGTEVAANLIPPNTKLDIRPTGEGSETYYGQGAWVPSDVRPGLRWAVGTYEAPPTYDESYLIFNGYFKKVTASGAGAAKTRVWSPGPRTAETIGTLSAQRGQAGATNKFSYVVPNTWGLEVNKRLNGARMRGDLLGQYKNRGTALTGSPSTIKSSPIQGSSFNVYGATTWAGLTSSPVQETLVERIAISFGAIRDFAAFLNSAIKTWDALGLIVPTTGVVITLPDDVSGSDFAGTFNLAKMDAGTPIFLRLEATGAELQTGINETFRIDMALKIANVPEGAEIGPFAGNAWPLQFVIDPTSGKFIEITTISATA